MLKQIKWKQAWQLKPNELWRILKRSLKKMGPHLKIVKVTVFISDLEKSKEFNDVYYSYFEDDKSRPVRCCIQIAKLHPGFEVEVEFIALD